MHPPETLSQRLAPDIGAEIDPFVGTSLDARIEFEAVETAVRRSASTPFRPLRPLPSVPRLPPAGTLCGPSPQDVRNRARPADPPARLLPACKHGGYPRDAALGLVGSSLSPGVLRMTGAAAALVSCTESSGLLEMRERAGKRPDGSAKDCASLRAL
ncbi:MAG: hypothetical protein OXG35_03270 [Acidobacteria bacterium]|nr:hypothetical protein [Acidobacteriota bacterium]